jgi:hypothetical protein
MKYTWPVLFVLLAITLGHGQDLNKRRWNQKSREFLLQAQAELVELSKTEPLLKGIDSVKISDVAPQNANDYVSEDLAFTKNTRVETLPIPANGPPPASNQVEVVDPDGLIFRIGVSDHRPKIPITKSIPLTPQPDSMELYYFIECHDVHDPRLAMIVATLNPIITRFVESVK